MACFRFARLGALALGGLLLSLSPLRAQEAALQDTTMSVPVVSLAFALGYIADDLGLWAKQGLRVKTVTIAGVGGLNAVIAGSVDFTQTSGTNLTRAAAHGQRELAIVEVTDRPTASLILRKSLAEAAHFDPAAPLATRAQVLRGRTIAVDAINSVIDGFVRLVAIQGGLDPESVRVAPMQATSMVAAFDTNTIDGFAISPPWPSIPVLAGTGVMIASGPGGDPAGMTPFANTVLVARPETCAKRPTVCAGMGKAFVAASAYMHDHTAAALALMTKRFARLDPKLVAAAFDQVIAITPNPPVVTKAALENADRYNIAAGFMKEQDKLQSYDDLFTDAYVR